jgi:NAD(P)-dependent dehydrogenase (short-subunit alcohol dehydrogenase family)
MKTIHESISLQGKTAIITGGAVNIGRATSLKLAEAGANIALIYHNSHKDAAALARYFESSDTDFLMVQADLSQEQEIISAVKNIAEHFGSVDVLVNNAGIFGLSLQEDLKSEDWDQVFDLNVRGLFLITREVIKLMKAKQSKAKIINVASINGLHPGFGKTAHYDATKGAVIAYTRSLAAEVAKYNIRVNAVAPGLVDSENLRRYAGELAQEVENRTPLKKIAQHNDIANAVLFLASDLSFHITGEVLVVDGGYLLS